MRKLRYAGNIGDGGATVLPHYDDPESPDFTPMEERSEMDKVRFWAKVSKMRDTRQQTGETAR